MILGNLPETIEIDEIVVLCKNYKRTVEEIIVLPGQPLTLVKDNIWEGEAINFTPNITGEVDFEFFLLNKNKVLSCKYANYYVTPECSVQFTPTLRLTFK